jgi:hypothetical protein
LGDSAAYCRWLKFIKPISDAKGWNASTVTFGIFISAMVAVPGAPLAGWCSSLMLLLCALLFITQGPIPRPE